MAFEKSMALMRLAEMAAARHRGVSLAVVMEEFGVNQRTAQRMIRGLELIFPVVHTTDDERRRWFKITDSSFLRLQGIRDNELAALEMSIRRAKRDQAELDVSALEALRDRLVASMLPPHARRAETDAEAMLEAQGFACRPGPRAKIERNVLGAIAIAIKAPVSLDIMYRGALDPCPRARRVEPYGLLLGMRQYLIARDIENRGVYRRFRVDRIVDAKVTGQSFRRDQKFSLDSYAEKSFGSFHAEAEYAQVIWRFRAGVASVAREFEFHPTQKVTEEADGSLTVEFHASGWIEMAWYIYQWGDQIEVIAPKELRAMVKGFQRSDLGVLP
jgi:predicted DNA-binding transcriptional regulator YafY